MKDIVERYKQVQKEQQPFFEKRDFTSPEFLKLDEEFGELQWRIIESKGKDDKEWKELCEKANKLCSQGKSMDKEDSEKLFRKLINTRVRLVKEALNEH
ncbi:hypothetical protein NVP1084O_019 [Vibrio phage 1.084.O._10N.261.49.F5]|nr:hypothetical protein NVP1084O_019 [Vibrio phage 1.084.O._10N.261.49.F5]